jgi:hypothetical protein
MTVSPPFQIGEEVVCVRKYSILDADYELEAGDLATIEEIKLWSDGSLIEDWASASSGYWHFHVKSKDGLVDKWAIPFPEGDIIYRAFKRPSELTDEDRDAIDKTKNYQPTFRIYSEFTTGLFRIFWKSRHPGEATWRELGRSIQVEETEPPRYSTLDLALACVEKVKSLPMRSLLRFVPENVNDPMFGNLVREITPC